MFGFKVNDEVTLKVLETREADSLFKLIDQSRAYLAEWLPFVAYTNQVEDSQKFIQAALQQFASGNGFHCGIWSENELVGVIGLHYIDTVNRKTSIGYYLGESHQKKGIMTQCTKAIIDYAFNELDLNRVEIRASVENIKSQAIPERLGFTKEGRLRSEERVQGRFTDSYVYSLLKSEWQV
ncbi:GNAT family N-acetyltransferase [Staphylococcus pasteuri]|uniref:GNAT family N-acetyltransferase n=1 Tax=Staphylococcus pasteuri TaxID=45972 RepID=UPI0012B85C25|nr:GNAT family protein [Staphylococcus pasteuri]